MSVLDRFEIEFDQFLQEHEAVISAIQERVANKSEALDEMFWENIDELKGYLAGLAANAVSDDPDEQEEAIAEAEEWVTDNMSASDLRSDIALTLWLRGLEDGPKLIDEQLLGC